MRSISSLFLPVLIMLAGYTKAYSQNPILVISGEKSYGPYTGEMLKTEGFSEYQLESLSGEKITDTFLQSFDVVILTADSLTDQQASTLTKYVNEGGNLIAFKPDNKLNNVFGITTTAGAVDTGYIAINAVTDIGRGLTSQPLQLHVPASQYMLQGSQQIATLYSNAVNTTPYPAVVMNDYGKGHAIAFAYNLPQNIVYTRQGNLHSAGKEMDGITGIRAMDLFTNGWVDTTKNTINQADEQMRLLSHSIEVMSASKKPLPRFWYFPDTLQCLVTLNNDGEDTKEAQFTKQFEDVDAKGAKMTLYVKEVDFISKKWIRHWADKGFEISGHPDDTKQATNPDWQTMDTVFKNLNSKLKNSYGVEPMRTVTNHWFVWCGKNEHGDQDFSAQVQLEKNNGIEMDCNYAHYDNGSSQGHFLGSFGINQGNYTGSGLTMKYANLEGNLIDVYQHFNNVYDQQYMEHDDKDGFFNCFKGLMDRSLDSGVYSFVSVKAHNAEYFFSEKPLMRMLDYANSRNIPVWTEIKFLDFMRAKDEAAFTGITWKDNTLFFDIRSSLSHSSNISYMIPLVYNGRKINGITSNDTNQPYLVRTIKERDYALLAVRPGTSYHVAVSYAQPR
ncbi:hypothetical protein QTN47_20840 [Danxiaibacter flavus]|uniref:Uncharacterized protein n=1 Tax=Danxiaibacter flavus TaxID=3049108 RepID=A0ABV3ZJI3_9BACT|nr:hypothetical protein QNM32_20845 [Chitinophagaceae bacterium DXS]